jgi:hypothetical protein
MDKVLKNDALERPLGLASAAIDLTPGRRV